MRSLGSIILWAGLGIALQHQQVQAMDLPSGTVISLQNAKGQYAQPVLTKDGWFLTATAQTNSMPETHFVVRRRDNLIGIVSMLPALGGSTLQVRKSATEDSQALLFPNQQFDEEGHTVAQWTLSGDSLDKCFLQNKAVNVNMLLTDADPTIGYATRAASPENSVLKIQILATATVPPGFVTRDGTLQTVSIGKGGSQQQVVGTTTQGTINKGTPDGMGWETMQGLLRSIAIAGDGTLWGTDDKNQALFWDGKAWTVGGTNFKSVAVGNARAVWGISVTNQIMQKTNPADANASWDGTTPGLSVAVGEDGTTYAIGTDQNIYQYDAARKSWNLVIDPTQVSGSEKAIKVSVGGAAQVVYLDARYRLFKLVAGRAGRNAQDWSLVTSSGNLRDAAIGSDGTILGISGPQSALGGQVVVMAAQQAEIAVPMTQLAIAQREVQKRLGLLVNLPSGSIVAIKSLRTGKYFGVKRINDVIRIQADIDDPKDPRCAFVVILYRDINNQELVGLKMRQFDDISSDLVLRVDPITQGILFTGFDFYDDKSGPQGQWLLLGDSMDHCYLQNKATNGFLSAAPAASWSLGEGMAWTRDDQGKPTISGPREELKIELIAAIPAPEKSTRIPGEALRVFLGKQGNNVLFWCFNNRGQVFSYDLALKGAWTAVSREGIMGSMPYGLVDRPIIDISMAQDGTIWALGGNWDRKNGGADVYRFDANRWVRMQNKGMLKIAIGSSTFIWGVNADLDPYQWTGSDWKKINPPTDVKFIDIAVGEDGTIIALSTALRLYRWEGTAWTEVFSGTKLLKIVVLNAGLMAGISADDYSLLIYTGQRWDKLGNTSLRDFALSKDGTLVGIGGVHGAYGGKIYMRVLEKTLITPRTATAVVSTTTPLEAEIVRILNIDQAKVTDSAYMTAKSNEVAQRITSIISSYTALTSKINKDTAMTARVALQTSMKTFADLILQNKISESTFLADNLANAARVLRAAASQLIIGVLPEQVASLQPDLLAAAQKLDDRRANVANVTSLLNRMADPATLFDQDILTAHDVMRIISYAASPLQRKAFVGQIGRLVQEGVARKGVGLYGLKNVIIAARDNNALVDSKSTLSQLLSQVLQLIGQDEVTIGLDKAFDLKLSYAERLKALDSLLAKEAGKRILISGFVAALKTLVEDRDGRNAVDVQALTTLAGKVSETLKSLQALGITPDPQILSQLQPALDSAALPMTYAERVQKYMLQFYTAMSTPTQVQYYLNRVVNLLNDRALGQPADLQNLRMLLTLIKGYADVVNRIILLPPELQGATEQLIATPVAAQQFVAAPVAAAPTAEVVGFEGMAAPAPAAPPVAIPMPITPAEASMPTTTEGAVTAPVASAVTAVEEAPPSMGGAAQAAPAMPTTATPAPTPTPVASMPVTSMAGTVSANPLDLMPITAATPAPDAGRGGQSSGR